MIEHHRLLRSGLVGFVDIGTGPPLVLVHGLGGTWRNWESNLAGLAQQHRVIALDLPGFGSSPAYVGPVSVDRYVDTLIDLLDELAIERATFVGNSLGGLLTIEIAARHPDRVAAAVLVSAGGIPLTARRDRLLTLPQARAGNRVMQRPSAQRALQRSPRLQLAAGRRIFHDPRRLPPGVLAASLSGLGAPEFGRVLTAADAYDARVRAPRISCPTLVVWGREDRLLPVAMAAELHRLIIGSRLEVWESTGHCAMIEDPARFDTLIAEFVAECRSGRT